MACAPVTALVDLAPGPELAVALARVAELALTGHEQVLVLRAVERQVNHYQGRRSTMVGAVLHLSDPLSGVTFDDDPPVPSGWDGRQPTPPGADEVRAALVLTRRGANLLCDLADDLATRLPQVRAAMVSGRLDQPRARVFSDWTADLCDRHAAAMLELARQAAPQLSGGDQRVWLDRLERDHDNMRAALDWAIAKPDPALGARLATALWRFWQQRGYLNEARARFERLDAQVVVQTLGEYASDAGDRGEQSCTKGARPHSCVI